MTAALPTLPERVEQYVAERRRLGFALRSEAQQLHAFARFAADCGHVGPLTLDLAVRWATEPSRRGRRFPGRRIEVLRPFARACAVVDGTSAVPPRGLVGPTRRRPLHHLYTAAQVRALLQATRALGPAGSLHPMTYTTLFGVLAVCGLRISEALHLERHEAELARDLLVIRMTKFRKSRLVPLHPTATAALRRYAAARDRLVPRPRAPRSSSATQARPSRIRRSGGYFAASVRGSTGTPWFHGPACTTSGTRWRPSASASGPRSAVTWVPASPPWRPTSAMRTSPIRTGI